MNEIGVFPYFIEKQIHVVKKQKYGDFVKLKLEHGEITCVYFNDGYAGVCSMTHEYDKSDERWKKNEKIAKKLERIGKNIALFGVSNDNGFFLYSIYDIDAEKKLNFFDTNYLFNAYNMTDSMNMPKVLSYYGSVEWDYCAMSNVQTGDVFFYEG